MQIKGFPIGDEQKQRLYSDLRAALDDPKSGRIFAVMGPNGAGKSKLIEAIPALAFGDKIASIVMPGNRRLMTGLTPTEGLEAHIAPLKEAGSKILADIAKAGDEFTGISSFSLAALLHSVAEAKGKLDADFERDSAEYVRSGCVGSPPAVPLDPRAGAEDLIGGILGYHAKISLADIHSGGMPHNRTATIQFRRGEATFGVAELSDGEQQILSYVALLIGREDQPILFLVDEPELYLNESRAVEIWGEIERLLPNSVFMYMTHNLTFATRPSVNRMFFLADGQLSNLDIAAPLPSPVVRTIAGARLRLLRTDAPIIFCEGGLDELLILDLFQNRFHPQPVGGWGQVLKVVTGDKAWKQVQSGSEIAFCGIIDQDMSDNKRVSELERQRVFCLPVYDAESFLLVPSIATWYLSAAAGEQVSAEEYAASLVDAATSILKDMVELAKLAVQDSNRMTIEYDFDLESGAKNIRLIEPTEIRAHFDSRHSALVGAIHSRNTLEILKLFKGKSLYPRIMAIHSKRFRDQKIPKALTQYNAVRREKEFHARLDTLPWLSEFKDKIEDALGATAG